MNLKLLSALLVLVACCASLAAAHGHSHDGAHHGHSHDGAHHGHSHEDVNPSFKYSRQANEAAKKAEPSHHHHEHHHHSEKAKTKEPAAGYNRFLITVFLFLLSDFPL